MAPVAIPTDIPDQLQPIPTDLQKPHQRLANLPAAKPIERAWRGNKAGTVAFSARPDFKGDKYAERQWIKEHMAAVFRFWGKHGYADGLSGHITVRDPVLPGYYWMNPLTVGYSSMKVSDLVLVDPEGYVAEGGAQLPINAAGFYIHSAIHKARPEIQAAAHCHSIHARTWSVFGKPIELLTQNSCVFYDNLSVYENFGGVVLASEEGERIAEAIGPKNRAVILQNHGALTLGATVDEACHLFFELENACRVQLMAEAAAANGIPKKLIDEEDAAYTASVLNNPEVNHANFVPEFQLLLEETGGAFLQ